MERGPLALFGALVAVGLGPAMWLGAQFGHAVETPNRPPTVSEQSTRQGQDEGGKAGAAPEDPTPVDLRTTSRDDNRTPATRRSTHKATTSPKTPSASVSPSSSVPSTPPTESTASPGADPPGVGNGGEQPPSPPTGGSSRGITVNLRVR